MSCPLCGDVCRCHPESCTGDPGAPPRSRFEPRDSAASGALSSWRREVTARVRHYHSRRKPRTPKYPSLRLKFDGNEPEWINSGISASSSYACVSRQAVAENVAPSSSPGVSKRQLAEPAYRQAAIREAVGKIIEFPRSTPAPVRLDELAEPVLDQLRILDVPEVSPPPPALGGILIEPEEQAEVEKRPGFDVPLQAAALGRRTLAGAVDGLVVLFAAWLFGYVFHRVTVFRPLPPQFAAGMAALAALLWIAYQYLFVVHSAHTLGLRLTRLQLNRFDGGPAGRRLRRWRVAASVLSAISLGMGYAWCFLDEDSLCWHDRITRTYLGPSSNEPKSSTAPMAGPARGRV